MCPACDDVGGEKILRRVPFCGSTEFHYLRTPIMNIDILTPAELATLQRLTDDANRIVICCHKSPDGDALGSSLALSECLTQKGKTVSVIIPDAYPDFLQWLPNTEKILRYDKHPKAADEIFGRAELVCCLDFNSASRVDKMQAVLERTSCPKLMIDHHLDPQMDTALTVSHPEMSSTAEIVFRILWQMGFYKDMRKRCATCIYCGMMTDTGAFSYNSAAPEIFFIVSCLLEKGVEKDRIYRNVYNNFSSWAIRLRGYIMCHKLNVLDDMHASYFSISRQTMRDFHFIKGDAEGLVNEPLRIKGMKLSVSLREDDRQENTVWVSLRSAGGFECNKMAEEFFNGGGHKNASGGRLCCSLDKAEDIVRQAIRQYADRLR